MKDLCFLQVIVFKNLFLFLSLADEITDLLLRLMEDSQMEVNVTWHVYTYMYV